MSDQQVAAYLPGTVLKHRSRNRYLRVLNPLWQSTHNVYVRNTDGAGFELDNKARWLTRRHLEQAYTVHYQPEDRES